MIDFKEEVAEVITNIDDSFNRDDIYQLIEIPPEDNMGDFALPCFKFAQVFKKAPNLIAEDIVEKIGENEYFEKIKDIGPYVNFFVNKKAMARTVLEEVSKKDSQFGSSDMGEGKNVIVEFSSPNIAKPFHIGHIRTTVIGHALRNIYQFLGFNTIAINHLGDYGTQFGKLIVAFKAWGDRETVAADPIPELLKLYVKFHKKAEENPELEDKARQWFKKLENGDEEAYKLWKWFKEVSLQEFNRVYDLLNINFDSFAGESFYSDKMPAVIDKLEEKELLKESEGAQIVDLEEYDMTPALIQKSDGSTLYITRDIAAAIYRKEKYNFYKNIYVVGSQQNLHFQQWFKILELMGYDWAKDCIHVPFGMVSLEEGTMSTRKGRVVFLEDVLTKAVSKIKKIIADKNPDLNNKAKVAKQVGVGAVIFQELSHSRIKDYLFSWDETLSFEGETGPYVQYTHARANSVLQKADIDIDKIDDYSYLTEEIPFKLIKLIYEFPGVVIKAMKRNEPSFITRQIINIAQSFNKFYHEYPVLVDEIEVKNARLMLVKSVKSVLNIGLKLLGIDAPDQM